MPLNIKPCHLRAARDYVGRYHRHSIPPVGGKFAVACYDGDRLCGVAICGRPVARYLDDGLTLEILRCCTDGTGNACSKLYSSASMSHTQLPMIFAKNFLGVKHLAFSGCIEFKAQFTQKFSNVSVNANRPLLDLFRAVCF